MSWTFVYLMLALKIPIVGLFWIVWWAIKAEPEAEAGTPPPEDGEGGSKHPRAPLPTGGHPRRRGPHGDPRPPAPPRSRPVTARGKHVTSRQRSDS